MRLLILGTLAATLLESCSRNPRALTEKCEVPEKVNFELGTVIGGARGVYTGGRWKFGPPFPSIPRREREHVRLATLDSSFGRIGAITESGAAVVYDSAQTIVTISPRGDETILNIGIGRNTVYAIRSLTDDSARIEELDLESSKLHPIGLARCKRYELGHCFALDQMSGAVAWSGSDGRLHISDASGEHRLLSSAKSFRFIPNQNAIASVSDGRIEVFSLSTLTSTRTNNERNFSRILFAYPTGEILASVAAPAHVDPEVLVLSREGKLCKPEGEFFRHVPLAWRVSDPN